MIEKIKKNIVPYFYSLPWNFFINYMAQSVLIPGILRYLIYKVSGMKIYSKDIFAKCFFKTNKIIIGKGTFINYCCFFDNIAEIEIGNNCSIAMEILFCTTTHEQGSKKQRGDRVNCYPIKVGDGCWIGARTTILPGVTIGSGCIIAAGALVNSDCECNSLYAGIPAKKIKNLK